MESVTRSFFLNSEEFRFDLCRKRDQAFGPVIVDHWWMPVTPLYAQRQGNSPPAHNHTEILRLYWAAVQHGRATRDQGSQERLLLASLVPDVRSEGSRTIFADAFLRPAARSEHQEAIQTLETLLSDARPNQLTRAEFHEQSWSALGRETFPQETQEMDDRLTRDLLDEPSRLLIAGDVAGGISEVRNRWSRLMRRIGRRAGHTREKIVLDVLSYEARAAFHSCYSVAWSALIPLLAQEEAFGVTSAAFLRFWHTDWISAQTQTSLFHGHVFGLHPATGLFMLTDTGPRLLGDWLARPTSVEAHGRLLNGILIALFNYGARRDEAAENRPRPSEEVVPDLSEVEELREERRRGRRRR